MDYPRGDAKATARAADDVRAQIDFPRHGVKWLALSAVKPTPVV